MEHFISIATTHGDRPTLMKKVSLADGLKFILHNSYEAKNDCWLVSNGYSDKGGKYTREEFNFQWIDTVILDADNDEGNPDTSLLENFKDEFAPYCYFLWESASSTPTCPKFRAILPLDQRVKWYDEPVKFTKKAIQATFPKYQDKKVTWYFSPTTNKINTFVAHGGKLFPSEKLENKIAVDRMFATLEDREREIRAERNIVKRRNPNGWRNFPSVKYCLGRTLPPHDRHDPLFKACSAMALNGYKDAIPQFLSEVDAPSHHKRDMMSQFK